MTLHATLRTTIFALSGLLAVASTWAQGSEPGARAAHMKAELQKRFTAADANGDGLLTRDEAKGKMPMVYKFFDEIDTSHSGSVSIADIQAFAIAKQADRQGVK